jgi:hypothetical protein
MDTRAEPENPASSQRRGLLMKKFWGKIQVGERTVFGRFKLQSHGQNQPKRQMTSALEPLM